MNFDETTLEKILGRKQHTFPSLYDDCVDSYTDSTILITGAKGSLGVGVQNFLYRNKIRCNLIATDIVTGPEDDNEKILNVASWPDVAKVVRRYNPDVIFHFAADKHAPAGEETPEETIKINIGGTQNLLDACDENTKIILASTCKSGNPETVYGATKLIAERLVLNRGHNVARFYNVVETSGNVFEIWNEQAMSDHTVTDCGRYFISLDEAISLVMFTGIQESGRYTIDPGKIRIMEDVYQDLYGGDAGRLSEPRRGDRVTELRIATSEKLKSVDNYPFEEIGNDHDVLWK